MSKYNYKGFNEKQNEVWGTIIDLLGEHFDHAVIAVNIDRANDENEDYMVTETMGGTVGCIGLATVLLGTAKKQAKITEDEEEGGD